MNQESWKDCLSEYTAIKSTPDAQRAKALIETAKARIKANSAMPVTEENSNFIFEAHYTSALEYLQALVLIQGFRISNHLCIGYYIKDMLKEQKLFTIFDNCRKERNALTYYGKFLRHEIAEKRIKELKVLIDDIGKKTDKNLKTDSKRNP